MRKISTVTGSIIVIVFGLICAGFLIPELYKNPVPEYPVFDPIKKEMRTARIQIGEKEIFVEVADTEVLRQRGLSGRDDLRVGWGMLFVFEKPGYYSFWMREMKFSLDMIWINKDWVITDISHNVDFKSYPKAFMPKGAAKYVLEVPAGYARENGISEGGYVDLSAAVDK